MSGKGGDENDEESDKDSEDAGDGAEVTIEENEEAPVVVANSPYNPTHEEKERHYATHLPYRNWCPVCDQARGREDDHKKKNKKDDGDVPTIVLDYKGFGQDAEDDSVTSIVMRDTKTGCTAAHICEGKGTQDKWVVTRLVNDIDGWGYTNIILKSDGEPAIVQMVEEIKRRRQHPTIPQSPPAYDPAANGVAEHAVQDYMAQMRACKIGLESRIKTKVETDWRVLEWMSEHAAMTLNRALVGHDGKTPIWRLMGKPSSKALLEFGEQVLAKPLRAPKTCNELSLRSKWVFGTWLGVASRTNEHLVALADGGAVVRVRTVKKRPEDDRWSGDQIRKIIASPRAPNPGDKDQESAQPPRLTRAADPGGGCGMDLPDAVQDELQYRLVYRNFKITKQLVEKFGMTDGCKGCEGQIVGVRRAHSAECRDRIEQAMANDDVLNSRLLARDSRLQKEEDTVAGEGGPAEMPVEGQNDEVEMEEIEDSRGVKRAEESEAEELKKEGVETVAKRRRVEEAINHVMQLIEKSKNQPVRRSICNINQQMHEIIAKVEPHPSPHVEKHEDWWKNLYENVDFVDDMHGYAPLDKDLATQARKLEMDYFKSMKVYSKVPRSRAKGRRIITTKWLDTNKGDLEKPNYRSRLVGREIKRDKSLDLFAATPPIETLRFLVARCAQEQRRKDPWRIAVADVRRAYFYAPATRDIYIEIPAEDRDENNADVVGKVGLSLYGTRDAAINWAIEYTGFMESTGFVKGASSPWNFWHAGYDLNVMVHGDDFIFTVPLSSIKWFQMKMRGKYEINTEIIGPEAGCVKEINVLGRIIGWGRRVWSTSQTSAMLS